MLLLGGGASGSSTAFWLRNVFGPLEDNKNIQVHTTIFDRNDYIGGRSTTVPIKGNASLGHLELGASIFVEANHNLMTATEKFGLKRTTLTALEDMTVKERPGLGVWNGKEFLYEDTGSYWDSLKALWRYGLTPLKVR
jgi:prenylcysteine oxidase/farnesylcysteine lyase